MNKKNFIVGDMVSWRSQARGSNIEKIGKVIAIIPSKIHYTKVMPNIRNSPCPWNIQFDGYPRNHESYLVEVSSKSGRGKPKLYWPRVSSLWH